MEFYNNAFKALVSELAKLAKASSVVDKAVWVRANAARLEIVLFRLSEAIEEANLDTVMASRVREVMASQIQLIWKQLANAGIEVIDPCPGSPLDGIDAVEDRSAAPRPTQRADWNGRVGRVTHRGWRLRGEKMPVMTARSSRYVYTP